MQQSFSLSWIGLGVLILIPLLFLACVFFIGVCISIFSRRNRLVGLGMMLLVGAISFLLVGATLMISYSRASTVAHLERDRAEMIMRTYNDQEARTREFSQLREIPVGTPFVSQKGSSPSIPQVVVPTPPALAPAEMPLITTDEVLSTDERAESVAEVAEFTESMSDVTDSASAPSGEIASLDTTGSDSTSDDLDSQAASNAGRPAWVDSLPNAVDGHEARVVDSIASLVLAECEQDIQVRETTQCQSYLNQYLTMTRGMRLEFDFPKLCELAEVARHEEPFVDQTETSQGTAQQIHSLLVFDKDFHRLADKLADEAIVTRRVANTGILSGGVLVALTTLFGLLKIAQRKRTTD